MVAGEIICPVLEIESLAGLGYIKIELFSSNKPTPFAETKLANPSFNCA